MKIWGAVLVMMAVAVTGCVIKEPNHRAIRRESEAKIEAKMAREAEEAKKKQEDVRNREWRSHFLAPESGSTPSSPNRFQEIVSERMFWSMFPGRHPLYTYKGLVRATTTFPEFAGVGDMTVRKLEIAAAFANFAFETDKFRYAAAVESTPEAKKFGQANNCRFCFNEDSTDVCIPGRQYYMRGPAMLLWAENYRRASFDLFGDDRLSKDPGLLERDSETAWRTGLWLWMTRPPDWAVQEGSLESYRSAHEVSTFPDKALGFGAAINAYTWGLHCRPGVGVHRGIEQRIEYFEDFARNLQVTPAGPNEC